MVAPAAERPMRILPPVCSSPDNPTGGEERRRYPGAEQLWNDGLEQALFKMRRTSGS
jgi:hypothetical protein